MIELFYQGGWLFMSLVTLMGLIMLFFAARGATKAFVNIAPYEPAQLYYVRFFGMLALVTGILGQVIGLYDAMAAVSQSEHVSQAMLAGGLRVSTITTLYGFVVFIIAHLIWFALDVSWKRAVRPD